MYVEVVSLSLDRLYELTPLESELTPTEIDLHGTKYIRSEYFKDGQRVFFSVLDFALNGPDEGSIIEREDKSMESAELKCYKSTMNMVLKYLHSWSAKSLSENRKASYGASKSNQVCY